MNEQELAPGVCRVRGRNCFEILLGSDQYRIFRGEGAFFLLPEWVTRWREIFQIGFGFDGQVGKDFMREMHTKLLYLDTGRMPVPKEHLGAASDALGLPWEVVRIVPDHLSAAIGEAIKRMAEHER